MSGNETHAVTGALGYSGRYIAQRLLDKGHNVISLSNSSYQDSQLAERISRRPFNFDDPERLAESLKGVTVLYNTYWVRFNHEMFSHSDAVRNTLILFEAAKKAGVKRIVHISITNPSLDSDLEYFREKAFLENELINSGISYAILRPAVIFGKEDILINNIAWFLRRFPVFGIFGNGNYKIQPIYVDDLAELAVGHGEKRENAIINAVGPETFTYKELVEKLAVILRKKRLLVSIPPLFGYLIAWILGKILNDVILTRHEIRGLMENYLYVDSAPTGIVKLTEWAGDNIESLGKNYHSELARRKLNNKESKKIKEGPVRTFILEIYAMFVCFITLSCLTVFLGIGLYDVVQILFPDITLWNSGDIVLAQKRAIQSLVKALIVISVNLLVFAPHWYIGKKARQMKTV